MDHARAVAGDERRRVVDQALELRARGRDLEDFTRPGDVHLFGRGALDPEVGDTGAVVNPVDLGGELLQLHAGEAEVHRGGVPFNHPDARALLERQRIEPLARLGLELPAHDGVHQRLLRAAHDLFAERPRRKRRQPRQQNDFFEPRSRHALTYTSRRADVDHQARL